MSALSQKLSSKRRGGQRRHWLLLMPLQLANRLHNQWKTLLWDFAATKWPLPLEKGSRERRETVFAREHTSASDAIKQKETTLCWLCPSTTEQASDAFKQLLLLKSQLKANRLQKTRKTSGSWSRRCQTSVGSPVSAGLKCAALNGKSRRRKYDGQKNIISNSMSWLSDSFQDQNSFLSFAYSLLTLLRGRDNHCVQLSRHAATSETMFSGKSRERVSPSMKRHRHLQLHRTHHTFAFALSSIVIGTFLLLRFHFFLPWLTPIGHLRASHSSMHSLALFYFHFSSLRPPLTFLLVVQRCLLQSSFCQFQFDVTLSLPLSFM